VASLSVPKASDGSGSKFFDPGLFGSIFCGLGWVSHLWFGFEFGKFLLKMSNFSIFSLWLKKNLFGLGRKVPGSKMGQPLIYCGSKVGSGRVMSGPISTEGQQVFLFKLSELNYIFPIQTHLICFLTKGSQWPLGL